MKPMGGGRWYEWGTGWEFPPGEISDWIWID